MQIERDISRFGVLTVCDPDKAICEVDVFPLEVEDLALSHPRRDSKLQNGFEGFPRAGNEPADLFPAQGPEPGRLSLEFLYPSRRVPLEPAPFDGQVEHCLQERQFPVERGFRDGPPHLCNVGGPSLPPGQNVVGLNSVDEGPSEMLLESPADRLVPFTARFCHPAVLVEEFVDELRERNISSGLRIETKGSGYDLCLDLFIDLLGNPFIRRAYCLSRFIFFNKP